MITRVRDRMLSLHRLHNLSDGLIDFTVDSTFAGANQSVNRHMMARMGEGRARPALDDERGKWHARRPRARG